MPSKREEWNNAGENVVVLHQFDRSPSCPNPSPYPIKFETYLRIAGIKYVNDFSKPTSPKGKSPWMTFNGKDMADSQLCLEHLAATMPDKDISAHLSELECAQAKGMRSIIEDHLYFCLVLIRCRYTSLKYIRTNVIVLPIPKFIQPLTLKHMVGKIIKQAEAQGIGRHSEEEVLKMAVEDLRALSVFLGDKPFMMGDKPSLIDCVLFGFVVVFLYTFPEENKVRAAIEKDFPNLKAHILMIKEKYWPDWDECLYKKT